MMKRLHGIDPDYRFFPRSIPVPIRTNNLIALGLDNGSPPCPSIHRFRASTSSGRKRTMIGWA